MKIPEATSRSTLRAGRSPERPPVPHFVRRHRTALAAVPAPAAEISDRLLDVVDGVSELIGKHIELAMLEVRQDAKAVGVDVTRVAGCVLLLLVGYLMLSVAAGFSLERYLAPDLAFFLVGFGHMVFGAVGGLVAVRSLRARRLMRNTAAEVETTMSTLTPR